MEGYKFEENEDSIIRLGEDELFQVFQGGRQKDFYEFMLTNKNMVWSVNEGSFFRPKYIQVSYHLSDIRLIAGEPEVELEDDEDFGKVLRIRFKEKELFLGADNEKKLDEIRDEIIEVLSNTNQVDKKISAPEGGAKQFCSQCGAKLVVGARFCSNCGYDTQI